MGANHGQLDSNWQQKAKCIWDGHVQKDDANQLDRTQNQQVDIRGAKADMSFPSRSQKKEATINTLAM